MTETDGIQPIERGKVPASAVGGEPLGPSGGGVNLVIEANKPPGTAAQPGTSGETSPAKQRNGDEQKKRQEGAETGNNGAVKPEGPDAAQQEIAKQDEAGVSDPDKAREALQEIAQEPAIQELLVAIFYGAGSPILEETGAKIVSFLLPGLSQENQQKLEKKVNSYLIGIRRHYEKRWQQVVDNLKNSSDPETQALGFDIELLRRKRDFLVRDDIVQINKEIENRQRYLSQNPNASDKAKIEAEIKELEEQREKAWEEEIKTIKGQRENIRDANGQEIPNQVETKLKPLAQQIAEAAGLTDEEKKALAKDPILMMAESFGRVIEPCIEIDENGKIAVNEENQKKLSEFIKKLKNQGIVNEAQANQFSEEFNSLVERLNKLGPEEKKLLRQIKIEKGVKKGLQIGLGILGVLALLAYMGSRSDERRGMG